MRDRAGLTQTQLAELVGVSQAQISKWESGSDVQLNTLQKVAAALDIQIEITGRSADREMVFRAAGAG